MRRNLLGAAIAALAMLLAPTASLANETEPGDVGTAECRTVQTTIQATVEGGEFRNKGQLLRTVARAANEPRDSGMITETCHECIVFRLRPGSFLASNSGASATVGGLCHAAEPQVR